MQIVLNFSQALTSAVLLTFHISFIVSYCTGHVILKDLPSSLALKCIEISFLLSLRTVLDRVSSNTRDF